MKAVDILPHINDQLLVIVDGYEKWHCDEVYICGYLVEPGSQASVEASEVEVENDGEDRVARLS